MWPRSCFPRLGLAEQLAPKSRRIESERVAAVVARGEVAIGFQQVSEILSIPGAAYAGPLPAEYQRVTTFSAGIGGGRRESGRRAETDRVPVIGRGGRDDRRDGSRAGGERGLNADDREQTRRRTTRTAGCGGELDAHGRPHEEKLAETVRRRWKCPSGRRSSCSDPPRVAR